MIFTEFHVRWVGVERMHNHAASRFYIYTYPFERMEVTDITDVFGRKITGIGVVSVLRKTRTFALRDVR